MIVANRAAIAARLREIKGAKPEVSPPYCETCDNQGHVLHPGVRGPVWHVCQDCLNPNDYLCP